MAKIKEMILPLLVIGMITSCEGINMTHDRQDGVASVEMLQDGSLEIITFADKHYGQRKRTIQKGELNYLATIDMVGGFLSIGEKKTIPISIGGIGMLEDYSLKIYFVPVDSGPIAPPEIVKEGTERYACLMQKYPDLAPNRSRLILAEDELC